MIEIENKIANCKYFDRENGLCFNKRQGIAWCVMPVRKCSLFTPKTEKNDNAESA